MLYGVGFSRFADGHCELELVNLDQMGFVAEKNLTVASCVKNELILLPAFQGGLAVDV